MSNEKVSIIMSVYNEGPYLNKAIDSILDQTYTDWEFIICDDASTDNTNNILLEYKKEYSDKFILLKNKKNKKLAYSLNRCLTVATGKYIARMDGDDISKYDRIEKQVNFLRKNKDVDLVGTAMQRFDGESFADILYPLEKPDKYTMRKLTPFIHGTILTYNYVYYTLKGYTDEKRTIRVEDRDLWFKFFYKNFSGENILEPLYFVRENIEAIERRTIKSRWNGYKTTLKGYKLLNYPRRWYVRPTIMLVIKSIIPTKLMMLYRKYQARKFIS